MYYLSFSHNTHSSSLHIGVLVALLAMTGIGVSGAATIHAQESQTASTTTDTQVQQTEQTTAEAQTSPESDTGSESESTNDTPSPSTNDGTTGSSTPTTADTSSQEEPIQEHATGTTSIDTGDATSTLTSLTEENTNETTASSSGGHASTTVTNNNTAQASTTGSVMSETGKNTATGSGETTIETGNAVSSANVINVINTNIFNSNGLIYFINVLLGNIPLDVRELFAVLTGNSMEQTTTCASEGVCSNTDATVSVENNNTASVENNVAVVADTGGNSAQATAGNATVETGNAYASANVVNLVNTNITDSNYLLMTVNNFSPGSGNVVFPSAYWFSELLSQNNGSVLGQNTIVTNNNTATVTSSTTVGAQTGTNAATGTTASVSTGDATASASIVNKVNENIIGNSFSLLFNIHGTWDGEIFGLPEGLSWRKTAEGLEIFFDASTAPSTIGSTGNVSVTNNNTASVKNNVSVYALTGENQASASAGNASVQTGDAKASANIVNVVNTNVLGRNWVLAIFNIFGDWNGNIAFGQPDLWIGARALDTSLLRGGSCFTYEVTVHNLGDADAHNVQLKSFYDTLQQTIESFDRTASGDMVFEVGTIRSGEDTVLTFPVCLSHAVSPNVTVPTGFEIKSTEDDADSTNNSERIAVTTSGVAGGSLLRPTTDVDLSIEKTASRDTISASSSVTYTITITNNGDPIYNAGLLDTIYNESGIAVHEQHWALETIQAGETIVVSYDAFFGASTTPGMYSNEAYIDGLDDDPSENDNASGIESPVANVDVLVTAYSAEQSNVCSPLLTSYIRYEADNDPEEVGKLQYFLNTVAGFETVAVTNTYNEATYEAVRAFQQRWSEDILAPWGMTRPSGYVYYTTQKKINELWCEDLDFSLSEKQIDEIETFRNRVYRSTETEQPLPVEATGDRFGLAPIADPVTAPTQEPEPAAKPEESDMFNTDALAFSNRIDSAAETPQFAGVGGAVSENSVFDRIFTTVRERIIVPLSFLLP